MARAVNWPPKSSWTAIPITQLVETRRRSPRGPRCESQPSVAATFGLVISEDDGATWRYACEPFVRGGATDNVSLYQVGPGGALFAVYYSALARSIDGGCSWTRATGLPAVRDVFADPGDASFVLAVATTPQGDALQPSHDGGQGFGPALYSTANQLFSVEIAASSRGVLYATEYQPPADAGS